MSPAIVSNLLLAGGALLGAMACVQIWRAFDLFAHGVRAEGTITRYTSEEHQQWKGQGEGSETVRLDYPHVGFALRDGSRVEFRSRLQRMTPAGLPQGSTVTVIYSPEDPAKTAEIAGPRAWFMVLFQTVPFTILTLGLLYCAARARGWGLNCRRRMWAHARA